MDKNIGYIALFAFLILCILFVWVVYNRLIKQKNLITEAWAAIDVCLKKRYDLVPNLIAVVQGIADHEKTLLQEVTKWRAEAMQAQNQNTLEAAENNLSLAIGKVNVVIEKYPNLVSGTNFLKLQEQLESIEDEIAYARRYYNGTIRNNNILIESFPSNIIAKIFNFEKPAFFQITLSSEKASPNINFE